MKKLTILILVIFLQICIFVSCGERSTTPLTDNSISQQQSDVSVETDVQKENHISNEDNKVINDEKQEGKAKRDIDVDNPDTEIDAICDKLYNNLYIGEVFDSGFIYIEPFNVDRGILNDEVKVDNHPDTVKFYPFENLENTEYYTGTFDSEFYTYVPKTEQDSKYFLQGISEPAQCGLRYATNSTPEESFTGIVLLEGEISKCDSNVKDEVREHSDNENDTAKNELIKDKEINADDRTLGYKVLNNTILGAKKICLYSLEGMNMEMLLSKYNTHGTEYAGTVYVLDFIKDGKVIRTYKKYNWDGPY